MFINQAMATLTAMDCRTNVNSDLLKKTLQAANFALLASPIILTVTKIGSDRLGHLICGIVAVPLIAKGFVHLARKYEVGTQASDSIYNNIGKCFDIATIITQIFNVAILYPFARKYPVQVGLSIAAVGVNIWHFSNAYLGTNTNQGQSVSNRRPVVEGNW
ncbi:hypothetical protein [Candidatus Protochlamydia amoebophila]|uniref:Uncharacterized protein n=1 Tax=Protochlamydia amoebophila (strain UWE25) TaxID=264201 RepID=Q6ME87_PARUW|nr:hypothetical protein [Candidatus Protochlamydia amoebophila]CAF23112.1 unnamed protein product [Candidatus Protochlamydia amoebophila UWE25]